MSLSKVEFQKRFGMFPPESRDEAFQLIYCEMDTINIWDKAAKAGHFNNEFVTKYVRIIVPKIIRDPDIQDQIKKYQIREKEVYDWIFPKLTVLLNPILDYKPPAPYEAWRPSRKELGDLGAPKQEYDIKEKPCQSIAAKEDTSGDTKNAIKAKDPEPRPLGKGVQSGQAGTKDK